MVEWAALEMRWSRKVLVSSNLTPSARVIMFKFFKENQKEPENLKEVLEYLKKLEKEQEDISHSLEDLKKESRKNLRKVSVVRFNPFKEIGGDQSFSIALLDADNNGFVITSHYHREMNRIYAKPIENGTSKYQLSEEEKEAINKAINV